MKNHERKSMKYIFTLLLCMTTFLVAKEVDLLPKYSYPLKPSCNLKGRTAMSADQLPEHFKMVFDKMGINPTDIQIFKIEPEGFVNAHILKNKTIAFSDEFFKLNQGQQSLMLAQVLSGIRNGNGRKIDNLMCKMHILCFSWLSVSGVIPYIIGRSGLFHQRKIAFFGGCLNTAAHIIAYDKLSQSLQEIITRVNDEAVSVVGADGNKLLMNNNTNSSDVK